MGVSYNAYQIPIPIFALINDLLQPLLYFIDVKSGIDPISLSRLVLTSLDPCGVCVFSAGFSLSDQDFVLSFKAQSGARLYHLLGFIFVHYTC